jgi:hypothetical protein
MSVLLFLFQLRGPPQMFIFQVLDQVVWFFGLFSKLACFLSWLVFQVGLFSKLACFPGWPVFQVGLFSRLACFLSWPVSSFFGNLM